MWLTVGKNYWKVRHHVILKHESFETKTCEHNGMIDKSAVQITGEDVQREQKII